MCQNSSLACRDRMRALLGLLIATFAVFFEPAAGDVFGDAVLMGRVGGKRTLVLVDSLDIKETHSEFFDTLSGRGHKLTYQLANSPDVVIYKYGEYVYDNVLLMCPSTEDFATLDLPSIVTFVEKGGNLMLVADLGVSDLMRDIAGEFGVDFDRKKARVIDHFSYEPALDDTMQHTAIITSEVLKNAKVVGSLASKASPVVYSGIGHAIDDDSILALKVLTGASSSYSAIPGREVSGNLEMVGKDTLLLTAVQARNNARALFAGSLSFFSNQYFNAKLSTTGQVSGNKALAVEVSKWVLGERGVLRASDVQHRRADGRSPDHLLGERPKPDLPFSLFPDPELNKQSLVYRIKDDVIYSLRLEEYDESRGGWLPLQADDVQLEFVMLDPYVRTFLSHDKQGRYSVQFTIPDVYGVYKFRVMYRRPGYSTIMVNTPVSIRPFHHDEYERFIFSAYPYYGSAFSMMAGFLVFGFFFLYTRESGDAASSKAKSS